MTTSHDRIYKLIGEATVAWNGIEHGWMLVFQTLLGVSQDRAKATYRAIISNAAQRAMISALAKAVFHNDQAMSDKIVNLANETGKESGWRNAFAHGFYGIDVYEVDGQLEYEISPLKIIEDTRGKLQDKDLETELPSLIAKFNELALKVWALPREIDEHAPSPDTRSEQ